MSNRIWPPRGWRTRPLAVAVPVRNEAERMASCLCALAGQSGVPPPPVVLLLNNCTDATASIVAGLTPYLPMDVHLHCIDLPPQHAHAGTARALAMRHAAALAGPRGVVLTTDADGLVPPDWAAINLAALACGADAATGRAVIDQVEARQIPAALHEADARECAYAALLDEIASLLDPDAADPWPRHTEESGASIAVSVAAWSLVGGMQPVPAGEDRAFVDRLRRHDRAIRHHPDIWVCVSGRTEGRAAGGMADTIRRRLSMPDLFLDDRLEPVAGALRRARLRRRARLAFVSGEAPAELARALDLALPRVAALLDRPYFGAAWAALEAESSVLVRRRVPVADLERQTALARAGRDQLRARPNLAAAIPAGMSRPAGSAVAALA